MNLADVFTKSMLVMDLQAREKAAAIRELLDHLAQKKKLAEAAVEKAERGVQRRESQGSTGIGKGLAIPHAKSCSFVEKGVLGVFGRSLDGIPFDSVDGELVRVIFLVLSAPDAVDDHLSVMKKVAMLHRDDKTLRFLASTSNMESIIEIFKEIDEITG